MASLPDPRIQKAGKNLQNNLRESISRLPVSTTPAWAAIISSPDGPRVTRPENDSALARFCFKFEECPSENRKRRFNRIEGSVPSLWHVSNKLPIRQRDEGFCRTSF